jgi:hypothetical protein
VKIVYELAKIYGENRCSCELVTRERETHVVARETAKLTVVSAWRGQKGTFVARRRTIRAAGIHWKVLEPCSC